MECRPRTVRLYRPLYLHAGRLCRLGDHRPRAGDPAYPADVGLQFRPRHRRGRRHLRAAQRHTVLEQAIGFFAVLLGAGNAAGGYAVTDRMLAMFQTSGSRTSKHHGARARSTTSRRRAETDMLTLIPQTRHRRNRSRGGLPVPVRLKRMSSPATAPSGIRVAGIGMVAAVLVSFLYIFSVDALPRRICWSISGSPWSPLPSAAAAPGWLAARSR